MKKIPVFYAGADAPVTNLRNRTRNVRWNEKVRMLPEQDAGDVVRIGGPFYRCLLLDEIPEDIFLRLDFEAHRVVESPGGEALVLDGSAELALRRARKELAAEQNQARKSAAPAEEQPAEDVDEDLLDGQWAAVAKSLREMDDASELEALLESEANGRNRKSVIKAAEERLAELKEPSE